MHIQILNGPNLNLLGVREPGIYGKLTFEEEFEQLHRDFPGLQLAYAQSNHEGELIDRLHEVGFSPGGIVINGGAFSHTSIALADAIRAIQRPVVAVHISNTFARESFRHVDLLAPVCVGLIAGLGLDGYRLAIDFLLRRYGKEPGTQEA
jgi:3-dehydroquinate dehydratase-2